ncbi:MAG: undecaprenyl-diphosphate phosphatase [Candidatus Improbicoccus devescovinae]|nr:MAG: undecaprenyl-diphosphate phosphatase [Candidatus Improbicoccus devescovinae]
MDIFSAIIQGAIQGLTEFLPISSSGHLIISQHFFNMRSNNLFFSIMLHLGTLISVILVYFKQIINIISGIFTKNSRYSKKIILNFCISYIPLFLIFAPIPGTGINLKKFAEILVEPPKLNIVGGSLIFTSCLLFIGILFIKKFKNTSVKKNSIEKLSFWDTFFIGIAQLFAAIFPGLSRSGSTLAVGLMCEAERQTVIDFSFLMSIPAILAASALELLEFKNTNFISLNLNLLLTGILSSAVFGVLAIGLFKWILEKNKIWIFGIYTFILGVILVFIN